MSSQDPKTEQELEFLYAIMGKENADKIKELRARHPYFTEGFLIRKAIKEGLKVLVKKNALLPEEPADKTSE